jgi:hypothetical protein
MKVWIRWIAALLALLAGTGAIAQDKPFSREQLDQILAPVALYPDSVLSQVLMAATYPSDVAQAAQWSRAHPNDKGDAAVKKVEGYDWDPSVMSLVAFPSVLGMMGDKPDWVQQLGDAFLAQPDDVMNAIQDLRRRAQAQGSLKTNEQQRVVVEQQKIIIEPAQPQVIYVPAYNPTIVYGPWWYPAFPPPFYWAPPPYYGFGSVIATGLAFGVAIGVTNAIWGGFNWGRNEVNINVNRYNNINVNNKITNVSGNNVSWKHNADNRKGVPYRDTATREKFDNKLAGANDRQNYRGKVDDRSGDRAKAEAAMRDKGITPPGRDRPAPGRDQPVDRPGTRDVPGSRDVAGSRDLPGKMPTKDARPPSRDNAFKDVSYPDRTREAIDRGQQSRDMTRPAPRPESRPTTRPAPQPAARPAPQPAARPAPRPAPQPAARPAPRPQPAARPAPAGRAGMAR